jgi:asparagine synthase (glutamine-hydrolysing)
MGSMSPFPPPVWCSLSRGRDGRVAVEGRPEWRGGVPVPDAAGREAGVAGGWTVRDGGLEITSDPYGYLPLYLFAAADRCVVANNPIAAVAGGAPGEPDAAATGLYARLGFYLGETTPFRHVRRVEAGRTVRWKDGKVEVSGDGAPRPGSPIASVAEGVEGYAHHFREAMRRRPPLARPVVLPLSGGRDSRMILLELVAMGEKPDLCVTFGKADEPDAIVAAELARRLGIRHELVDAPTVWLRDELVKHARCGLEAGEHTWMVPLFARMRELADGWHDGLGVGAMTRGETCQPAFLERLETNDLSGWSEELFRWTFGVSAAKAGRLAAVAGWFDGSAATAHAQVGAELRRRAGWPNPLTAFSFANWGRRCIALAPLGICGGEAIQVPFMDRELCAFVSRLPVRLAFGNDLQTDALHRLHPEFRDVPFDKEVAKDLKRTAKARAGRRGSRVAGALRKGSAALSILGVRSPLARTAAFAELRGDRRLASVALGLALVEHCSEPRRAREFLAAHA